MARYKLSDRAPKLILWLSESLYPETDIAFPGRFASDDQFAADVKLRLNKIAYPYLATRAQAIASVSTYEELSKRGVVNLICDPSVIRRLKFANDACDYASGLRQLHSADTTLGKKFRNFHTLLAKELIRHATAIRRLRDENVGDEWIGPYLQTAEERIVSEMAILRIYTKEKTVSENEATREWVTCVYSEISSTLRKARIENHTLFCHLTSVICSPNCLNTGVLSPSPEAVRKLLSRNPVKKPAKSRN